MCTLNRMGEGVIFWVIWKNYVWPLSEAVIFSFLSIHDADKKADTFSGPVKTKQELKTKRKRFTPEDVVLGEGEERCAKTASWPSLLLPHLIKWSRCEEKSASHQVCGSYPSHPGHTQALLSGTHAVLNRSHMSFLKQVPSPPPDKSEALRRTHELQATSSESFLLISSVSCQMCLPSLYCSNEALWVMKKIAGNNNKKFPVKDQWHLREQILRTSR